MKKIWNVIKEIVFFIWQLPQNLVGCILYLILLPVTKVTTDIETIATVYKSDKMTRGISLGKFAFVSTTGAKSSYLIRHEGIGHAKQSLIFGPLYLIVIGIPSALGNENCFTEKWADKLAENS